jgi:hypothetical protein
MRLLIVALLVYACCARYIGIQTGSVFDVDIETGEKKTIGTITSKPPPGTFKWIMDPNAAVYATTGRSFFSVMTGVITGKYAIVKYDRDQDTSFQGPYLNYRVRALYTFDRRLFGVSDNLTLVEYDFNTLKQLNIRKDLCQAFVIVFPGVAFDQDQYQLTVHTYIDEHTRLLTLDAKQFDVPKSKLVVRDVEFEYNVRPLFINPVNKGHLLAQWNWSEYTGYEDLLDIVAKDGSVPRIVTVIPPYYKGTASTKQMHSINEKTGEYIMGLLERGALERQFVVIIDLKKWEIKSVKLVPKKLLEFKLFVTDD